MKITKFNFVVACFLMAMNTYSGEFDGSGFNSLIQTPVAEMKSVLMVNGIILLINMRRAITTTGMRYQRMAGSRTGKW